MSSLGGFGQGFANGLQAGSEHLAARARMQAVQQEQIDQKLEYYNSATQAVIKNIQEVISQAPQRTPELEQTVAAMRAHAEDAIKGISQFGDKGRVLSMALGNSLTQAAQTPTMSEAASNKFKASYKSGQDQAKMLGYDVPDLQDPAAGMAAAQQGQLPQELSPPATPPSAPPAQQQVAQATPQATPAQAPAMPQAAPAAQVAPAAPAPSAPMTDQAEAAPAAPAPQQAAMPEAPKPLIQENAGDWRTKGKLNTGNVPVAAIEYLVSHPETADMFVKTYNVDPTSLLKGEEAPTERMTAQTIMRQALGMQDTAYDKAMGEQKAKQWGKRQDTVNSAKQLLQANAQARDLLMGDNSTDANGQPQYGIYSGILSGAQLTSARIQAAVNAASPETLDKLARTQDYIAALTGVTGQIIKQFGAGTGLSDADREFARQAAGQDISFTPQALERLLDINSRAAIWVITHPDQVMPESSTSKASE